MTKTHAYVVCTVSVGVCCQKACIVVECVISVLVDSGAPLKKSFCLPFPNVSKIKGIASQSKNGS